MLPDSDLALIARDAALPGLRLALDASALASRCDLPPMRAAYLRYKPGTSCVASLIPENGGLDALAVMAYTPPRFAEARSRPEWLDGPNPAVLLEDACVALVPLARDRALKGARRLADPDRAPRLLRRLLGSQPGTPPRLLRYKAGRRAVLRAGDALIKCYTAEDYGPAYEAARLAETLGSAPLIGASERHHCLAWRWLDGASLCPEEGSAQPCVAWRMAGEALAKAQSAAIAPHRRAPDASVEIAAQVEMLAALDPDLASLAQSVASRLAAALDDAPATLIHGDFSADQVIIHDARATIIDWDRAASGDPARDVGSFLARLDAQVIGGTLEPDRRDAAADAFLNGYRNADGPARSRAIPAQHARALIALAPEAFRSRRADWPDQAAALLRRAEALLRDPKLPRLATALDPVAMRLRLTDALGYHPGSVSAELLRHKPGRRALIRYRIDGRAPTLGKLRAKGADTRTPALHDALRAAGFDGSAPMRVGVPATRGIVSDPALWLQDEVPGRVLTDCLAPNGATAPLRQTGAALAELHKAQVPARRDWSMQDEREVLERALSEAIEHLPNEADEIAHVLHGLSDILSTLPPVAPTGIHRDFYPDQILIDGQTTWLLDLDLYANGDPAIDLGNFLAHLDEHSLRFHGNIGALKMQAEAFLQGYASRAPLNRARVESLRLISLARHIAISLRLPGREQTTRPLIAHCSAALADLAA
ncbi:phosphotransferase [Marivita sp. GX14005]|uniref:phosphotransferase n=1 Tax=Marivita sp. GX14005 TaxID=2942276 RepID=UPI002019C5A8|nr:phosphotransferase [Marivita sp. GX14005]MCL3883149.1 aminoglycoside phosphotransferase family protein [Marivita sp. GX14005]